MLTNIYNQVLKILTSEGFNSSYVYLNNKHENRLNTRFATIDVLSDKVVGKAVSSDSDIFDEYELEVKITMYFKPSESIDTVESFSDTILQRFYQSTDVNITNIFSKTVCYSSIYKCYKSEIILKLSYLLEEAS